MAKNTDKLSARSDTNQPSKRKQKSEEYLEYQRYIKGKRFQQVKNIVLERDGYRCQFCNRGKEDGVNLSVHHRTYKHLYEGGELEAADCITVCCPDHVALHRVKSNYSWFSMNNPRNATVYNAKGSQKQNDNETEKENER